MMAGSDIRYPFPGHDHHALIGAFAPNLALHTDRGATSVAELMHGARPILIDLADRVAQQIVARIRENKDRLDRVAVVSDDIPPTGAQARDAAITIERDGIRLQMADVKRIIEEEEAKLKKIETSLDRQRTALEPLRARELELNAQERAWRTEQREERLKDKRATQERRP